MWPGIWLGAFVSNALTNEPALTAASIAAGNTVGPLLGAFVLRRFTNFDKALERLSDVIAFVLIVASVLVSHITTGLLLAKP